MKVLIDTSAWIEYFIGSEDGRKVQEYIEANESLTSVVSLLELSYKADKEGWNIKSYLDYIKLKSVVIGIKESSIIDFGKVYNNARKKEKNFGFADGILLLTSIKEGSQILTKDRHFKDFENSILLE